jgi:hypothetical protein
MILSSSSIRYFVLTKFRSITFIYIYLSLTHINFFDKSWEKWISIYCNNRNIRQIVRYFKLGHWCLTIDRNFASGRIRRIVRKGIIIVIFSEEEKMNTFRLFYNRISFDFSGVIIIFINTCFFLLCKTNDDFVE